MYSGFITSKRTSTRLGVHQRFDRAAYRSIQPYISAGGFPEMGQILHFEGANGPDGLKAKSPGKHEPSHLYNPKSGSGELLDLIASHYRGLVTVLGVGDMVRAGFEAAWLAHYICDGLTPAHHFPLDEFITKHGLEKTPKGRYRVRSKDDTRLQGVKTGWELIGGRGLLTTHFNFEMGVATALVGYRLRVPLNMEKLARARAVGPLEFFKQEAREISELAMYETFYHKGWTAEMGTLVRKRLAPQSVQAIAIVWLLAYLESGQRLAMKDRVV